LWGNGIPDLRDFYKDLGSAAPVAA
jgi:hypothetical protein